MGNSIINKSTNERNKKYINKTVLVPCRVHIKNKPFIFNFMSFNLFALCVPKRFTIGSSFWICLFISKTVSNALNTFLLPHILPIRTWIYHLFIEFLSKKKKKNCLANSFNAHNSKKKKTFIFFLTFVGKRRQIPQLKWSNIYIQRHES